jgi:pimeloyl-ACP methyl ester carboxylesterase
MVAASLLVYFAFPEVILRLATESLRRSAGLERREIQVGQHEIVYLEGGSGPPVVLLHGFAASKDLWTTVGKRLTPSYRVVAPDLPGFGESSKLRSESYDIASQVERVHAFVKALELSRYHLAGQSMGGAIAAAFAAAYPEEVISLILSAAPGVDPPEKTEFAKRIEQGENPLLVRSEEELDEVFRLVYFQPPSLPGPIKRAMLKQVIESRSFNEKVFEDLVEAGPEGLAPILPQIEARTLILWGDHDYLVHPSSAEVFAEGIARHEVVILENCGHVIQRECPDEVARHYLAFLAAPR